MPRPEDPERRSDWLADLASHRLAFRDDDFMDRDELRPFRLALELLKAEISQKEQAIVSTIVLFGSARSPSPEDLNEGLARAEEKLAEDPDDREAATTMQRLRRQRWMLRYYEEARQFARRVATDCKGRTPCEWVITTGGGPGIMEAGNRGAHETGSKTIGLNIEIPFEQVPNPYITPELCLRFHYFAIRKMQLLLRAKALVIFPGGFGTLDELFDALTLIQTTKMRRIPIVMLGAEYWSRVLNLEVMVEAGTIDAGDVELIDHAETADEAWDLIKAFYRDRGETPFD